MEHEHGLGQFDDRRLEQVGSFLLERLCTVGQSGDRAEELRIPRFLRNERVTPAEMFATAGARTTGLVRGRHVLAIQDTTTLRDDGKKDSLLLRPTIAVDASTRITNWAAGSPSNCRPCPARTHRSPGHARRRGGDRGPGRQRKEADGPIMPAAPGRAESLVLTMLARKRGLRAAPLPLQPADLTRPSATARAMAGRNGGTGALNERRTTHAHDGPCRPDHPPLTVGHPIVEETARASHTQVRILPVNPTWFLPRREPSRHLRHATLEPK